LFYKKIVLFATLKDGNMGLITILAVIVVIAICIFFVSRCSRFFMQCKQKENEIMKKAYESKHGKKSSQDLY
jgi:hypothetical protein